MAVCREILITPKDLCRSNVIKKRSIIAKRCNFVLKGVIVDKNNEPISGAIIDIMQIDKSYCTARTLQIGYYTTNSDGSYAILLDKGYNIQYRLEVYEPNIVC